MKVKDKILLLLVVLGFFCLFGSAYAFTEGIFGSEYDSIIFLCCTAGMFLFGFLFLMVGFLWKK